MNQQKRRRQRQLREQRRRQQEGANNNSVVTNSDENGYDETAVVNTEDFADDEERNTSSKSVQWEDDSPAAEYNNDKPTTGTTLPEKPSSPVEVLSERLYSKRHIDRTIYDAHLKGVDGECLTEKYLSPDVYSLIYVCNPRSACMLYCLGSVFFQFTIIVLLILSASNAMNDDRTSNFFAVPIDVDTEVRVSQLFALILLVSSQDDFIYGISFFFDGYTPEILKKAPYATATKFYIAGTLKMCEAVVCLFITFILIVQSSTVIGLFLNFAALAFVYCIDDVFFNLAGSFMFSDELAILVSQVRTMMVPIPFRVPTFKDTVSSYRFINLIYTICILVVGWVLISLHQIEGRFACNSLLVQFGDEAIAALSLYSGAYDRKEFIGEDLYQVNKRFVYVRREPQDAIFAYCLSKKQWVFVVDMKGQSYKYLDPCIEDSDEVLALAVSAETKTYDLLETTNTPWSTINIQTRNLAVIDYFTMVCNECDNTCKGTCDGNKCVCDEGNFGLDCEFNNACDNLTESRNHDLFQKDFTAPFHIFSKSSRFLSNDRPIYYRYNETKKMSEFIMFLGRRWGYFLSRDDMEDESLQDEETLYNDLIQNITIQYSNLANSIDIPYDYLPEYLSDTVSYGTVSDTGQPTDGTWYKTMKVPGFIAADTSKPQNSRLLCPVCDVDTNPCQYDGVCTNQTCVCSAKYYGSRCEAAVVV